MRLSEDDQGRTFDLRPSKDRTPELFNSNGLRCIFSEDDLKVEGSPIPVVRRSGRRNVASIAHDVARAKKYLLPTDLEGIILSSLN